MSSPNHHPNPYVGPRAFQLGETLYGRDYEHCQLLDLVIAERIVLLHSPSGAGKSSLIQAGLLPSLEEEGFHVFPPARVNLEPPEMLRDDPLFNRYTYSALVSLQEALPETERTPTAKLAQMTLDEYLSDPAFRTNGGQEAGAKNQFLIFDQFEEILTVDPTNRREKAAFFIHLGAALRHRNRWALFAMREDYLAALDPYVRPVPTRFGNTFRLDFLGKEAAMQAIQRPAVQAGVDFKDDAVQKLVDDLRRVQVQRPDGSMEEQLGPYVEPVQLQVVCYRLWDHLPENAAQIQVSDIESVGDVDAALADYYAERVSAAAAQTGAGERAIRDWFEHQLITPQGIRGQVLMSQERSGNLDNRAIRELENAHLVRAEKRGGAIWFELAHDRLIGPVRKDNAAWFQANLTLFQRQAALWESEKRLDSLLLREKDLEEAEGWAQAHDSELTDTERSFLEACRELRNREMEARKLEEAQQQAEAERQRAELQARSARQLRRLARIIAAALVVAIITTVLAFSFWQRSNRVASSNATLAAINEVIAITAQNASTLAIAQQQVAEAASTQESYQRQTAEAASVLEFQQRQTADAASLLANDQRATAQYNAEIARQNAQEAAQQASIAFSRQLASQSLVYLSSQRELALLLGVEAYQSADTLESKSALISGLQRSLSQTVNQFGRPIPQETESVMSVSISKDGRHLAWSNANGDVVVWDYQQGEPQRFPNAHQGIVWGVDLSPDGKSLASAGQDGSIQVWDLASGESTAFTNINKVLSVSWSPDSARFAAAVGPHLVVWDVSDTRNPVFDKNLLFDVNMVSWSPDGSMVAAAASDGIVYIVDPALGETVQRLSGHTAKVKSVGWSPDSHFLASGGADRMVVIWDLAKGQAVGEPLKGHTDEVFGVSFSYDNNILASGSKDGTIILWNAKTFRPFSQPLAFHTSDVTSLAFIQTGGPTLLVSGSLDKSVQLRQIITQQPLSEAMAPLVGDVLGLAVEPDGSAPAVSRQETVVNLWEVQANRKHPSLPAQSSMTSAALSSDGTTIALGDQGGGIQLFEAASAALLSTIDTASGEVFSLAFDPENRRLASSHCARPNRFGGTSTCEQTKILIWDTGTGDSSEELTLDQVDFIVSMAFSPGGEILALGGQDSTIRLWDLAEGKLVALPLARHLDQVTSLAFSADGRILASGSADNTLLFWDVETAQPIGEPLIGSPGGLFSLAFSPDGKYLYSGSLEGSVLRWDTDFTSWVQRACALAGRNLTPDEWEQFFRSQNQPYRKTCEQFQEGEAASTPAPTATPTPAPTPTPTPAPN